MCGFLTACAKSRLHLHLDPLVLPHLTTSDEFFHLFYCVYGGIFECESQQDWPVAGFLGDKSCQIFGADVRQRLQVNTNHMLLHLPNGSETFRINH